MNKIIDKIRKQIEILSNQIRRIFFPVKEESHRTKEEFHPTCPKEPEIPSKEESDTSSDTLSKEPSPFSTPEEKPTKNLPLCPFGTIIWAKRYHNDFEKSQMKEGHREGPFLVLESDSEHLVAVVGTGIPPKTITKFQRTFMLNHESYVLNKTTYFNLGKRMSIHPDMYEASLGNLTSEDRKRLEKSIQYLKERSSTGSWDKMVVPQHDLEPGDIVRRKEEHYLVTTVQPDTIEGMLLRWIPTLRRVEDITYSTYQYGLEIPLTKKEFSKEEVTRIDSLTEEEWLRLSNQWQMNDKDETPKMQRGSLFEKEKKLYYIYGEEGQDWLTFSVQTKGENKQLRIDLNANLFYLDVTKSLKFSKSMTNYQLKYNASWEEMDKIKRQRKEQKQEQNLSKEKKGKRNFPGIQEGTILQFKNLDHTRYVVLERENEGGYAVELSQIEEEHPPVRYLFFSHCFIVGTMPAQDYLELQEKTRRVTEKRNQKVLKKKLPKEKKKEEEKN